MNEDGLTALDNMALLGLSSRREAHENPVKSTATTVPGALPLPLPTLHPLFFGRKPCANAAERKFEKPWHRIALHQLAQGEDAKTVAELCDKNVESIYQLCRTPWFASMLADEIKQRSGVGLVEQFQADCALARSVENELLANGQTPPAVRASIAKTKIERVYGKAKQLVEFDNITQSSNPVAEAEELERSIVRDIDALNLSAFPAPSGQS